MVTMSRKAVWLYLTKSMAGFARENVTKFAGDKQRLDNLLEVICTFYLCFNDANENLTKVHNFRDAK